MASSSLGEATRVNTELGVEHKEITKQDVKEEFEPQLPLARIKKIMKSDPNANMITFDAPIVFSKAAEMFVCELALRAWGTTEKRTLQVSDIAQAITSTGHFEFLEDLIPEGIENSKTPPTPAQSPFMKVPNGKPVPYMELNPSGNGGGSSSAKMEGT